MDPGFFAAVGIRILQGRNFDDTDLEDAPQVAIINEAMAHRFWPGEDAIGRVLRRSEDPDLQVIGVVSTAKIRSLGEAPRSCVYRPYSQTYSPAMWIIAKTELNAQRTSLDMLSASRALEPGLIVIRSTTMERHLGIVLLPARMAATLLTVFAGLGLTLACIGLYGLVSYAVSQRTREVGIRMSLGADHSNIVRMLMGSGMKLVAVGGGVGLLMALLLSRLLSRFLFGVADLDLLTFLGVPLVLAVAACVAAYVPARRATRVNPVNALKTE